MGPHSRLIHEQRRIQPEHRVSVFVALRILMDLQRYRTLERHRTRLLRAMERI